MKDILIKRHDQDIILVMFDEHNQPCWLIKQSDIPGNIVPMVVQKILGNQARGEIVIDGAACLAFTKLPAGHKITQGTKIMIKINAKPQKGKGAKCTMMPADSAPLTRDIWDYIQDNFHPQTAITIGGRDLWAAAKQKIPQFKLACLDKDNIFDHQHIYQHAVQPQQISENGTIFQIHTTPAGTIIDIDSDRNFVQLKNDNDIMDFNQKSCRECARIIAVQSLSGLVMIDFLKPKNRNLLKTLCNPLRAQFKSHYIHGHVLGFGPAQLCEITIDWGIAPLNERVI